MVIIHSQLLNRGPVGVHKANIFPANRTRELWYTQGFSLVGQKRQATWWQWH
jgi:hypothetical protein